VTGNTFAPASGGPGAIALTVGDPGSVDPGETSLAFTGNVASTAGATISVPSATINGAALVDGSLPLAAAGLPALGGLRLVNDTGASATDGVTSDGRLRFDPIPGASRHEYQVGSGAFVSLGTATSFLPAGLAAGRNTVVVRAVDAAGNPGVSASITFTLQTAPPVVNPPALDPASDTGQSQTDRITGTKKPVFNVAGAAADQIQLYRNGVLIASRTGPGAIQDPGVSKDGAYSYTLVRTGLAGGRSTSAATVVTIDTTPPPAVAGLTSVTGGKVQFRATQSGVVYAYRVGSTGAYVPLGTATSFTPAALAVGRNVVSVHAVDVAGNVGPDATVVLTVAPPAITGTWIGQDGSDYVGPRSTPGPDGVQDIHVTLGNLRPDHAITALTVTGYGGGIWDYNVPSNNWRAAVVRAAGATTANVYIQPSQVETGRRFDVRVTYDDGVTSTVSITGKTASPLLRVGASKPSVVAVPSVRPISAGWSWWYR
jgi:hypothetical protein